MSRAVNYVNNQDWVPRLPGSVEFLEKAAPGCKIDMDLEFLKLFRTGMGLRWIEVGLCEGGLGFG